MSDNDNGGRYDAEGFDRLLERRIEAIESREDSLTRHYACLQASADLQTQALARNGVSLFELREEMRAAHLEVMAKLEALTGK